MVDVPGTEGGPPPGRPTDWAAAVEWCRRNPGKTRWFHGVYANAPHAVRRRYRDILVGSENHRDGGPDDRAKRVCDMWICEVR